MKKPVTILCTMATVIGLSVGNPFHDELTGNVIFAASPPVEAGNGFTADRFGAEFAYEMAKITAGVVTASDDPEAFKMEFAYAIANVNAKVLPIIPGGHSNRFAYEMAQITAKVINDKNLDVQKAKTDFAYDVAVITTSVLNESGAFSNSNYGIARNPVGRVSNTGGSQDAAYVKNNADFLSQEKGWAYNSANYLKNNADVGPYNRPKENQASTVQNETVNSGYISPETYNALVNELVNAGKRTDHKVNIDGQVRVHARINSGPGILAKDSYGLRLRVGFDTAIYKDWRFFGMLEGETNIQNYYNDFDFTRMYVAGRLGDALMQVGSFGYYMADGNIYDSDYKGIRADFPGPLRYTLAFGRTNYTDATSIATVRYDNYDYDLEAGVYHNEMKDGTMNTIWTVGGNYKFSNFSVGAMYLGASKEDAKGNSDGYVFSLNYGDLKTWRPHTYAAFAKYYNQPKYTYLQHGMDGLADWMSGFKGYGLGFNYTFRENLVGGIEYYDLEDLESGNHGKTWWNQVTYYF